MSDGKYARVLLESADRDAQALRVMRHPREVSDEVFGFHVQQAAEKALKAWLALLGVIYPLTHNITSLFDLLTQQDDIARYRELIDYTPYAVEFRYDGVAAGTAPIERERALRLVDSLIAHVRLRLADSTGNRNDARAE